MFFLRAPPLFFAMEFELQFFESGDLTAIFEALSENIQTDVLAPAVKAGQRIIQVEAGKNYARMGAMRTGALIGSLRVKVKKYKGSGVVYSAVGPSRDFIIPSVKGVKGRVQPSKYIHLVERGTRHRKSKAKPGLREALDNNRPAVAAKLQKIAARSLARQVAKLRHKTGRVKVKKAA